MSGNQFSLSQLASQGNAKAITTLLNRSLQPKGITAKVVFNEGFLKVLLESSQTPNQQALVPFVTKGIIGLKSDAIKVVKVYGKLTHENSPAWSEQFELMEQPFYLSKQVDAHSTTPTVPKKQGQPRLEADMKAQKASSTDSIAESKIRSAVSKSLTFKSRDFGIKSLFNKNKRVVTLLAVGLIAISATWVIAEFFSSGIRLKEDNERLVKRVEESSSPEEGFSRLSELAQQYKKPLFSNSYDCKESEIAIERERREELKAQQEWELVFVNEQEIKELKLPYSDRLPGDIGEVLRWASSRIRLEKECGKSKVVFPLREIDISDKKYPRIVKVDNNSELGYITFAMSQSLGFNASTFEQASLDYLQSQISGTTPIELLSGYKTCQKIRNKMVTDAASMQDSFKVVTKEVSSKEKETASLAVAKLCPQISQYNN